ncbi:hypothetical protein JNJ66_01855 [Candidatus Saccharibacteria bacterium]|nr:hypothetical protein [Candidatus Saccharibacteria bacterium]
MSVSDSIIKDEGTDGRVPDTVEQPGDFARLLDDQVIRTLVVTSFVTEPGVAAFMDVAGTEDAHDAITWLYRALRGAFLYPEKDYRGELARAIQRVAACHGSHATTVQAIWRSFTIWPMVAAAHLPGAPQLPDFTRKAWMEAAIALGERMGLDDIWCYQRDGGRGLEVQERQALNGRSVSPITAAHVRHLLHRFSTVSDGGEQPAGRDMLTLLGAICWIMPPVLSAQLLPGALNRPITGVA